MCQFPFNNAIRYFRIDNFKTEVDTSTEVPIEFDPEFLQESSVEERDIPKKDIFTPGSIHSLEAAKFWKEELKANDWVMGVIEKGYIIPFKSTPENYEEANNRSAKKNMEFVREEVRELVKLGVVERSLKKPHCVSPLTVSEKTITEGKTKLRLCLDGSRCINLHIQEEKVTLTHFQRSLELTKQGDFQTKYDLKSAYHHIKIYKPQTKYLGFAIENEKGGIEYYVFLYLPFGLASAVHAITKIFKPINAYLHSLGIRHAIYIDDGRALADSPEIAEKNRQTIYQTLKQAGWIIETNKSDQEGQSSQVKSYLGFIIDTKEMTVSLSPEKILAVRKSVEDTLEQGRKPMKAKELAKTLGKMVSTEPALGGMPLMAARAGYIQLEIATEKDGWNTTFSLSKETMAGLNYFIENLHQFNHTPIRTDATEISVLSIIGPPDKFITKDFVANHVRTKEKQIWASDASGFATCAYSIQGDDLYFRGKLDQEQKQTSSGHRELMAVRYTLEYYMKKWDRKNETTNIYWLTDSTNLVTFLTKGSGKIAIQREVFRVMDICQRMKLKIIPIHLRREDPRIQIADDGSKISDTDDWQVDYQTFTNINEEIEFTIDLFASDTNNKCKRFYSNFYCAGTLGIDAFCHDWAGERCWICPPVKEITKIIKKIRKTKVSGVLYIPEWQTADFWTEIFSINRQLVWPFKTVKASRPYLIQKEFNSKSPFRGRSKFEFLELKFET